MTKRLLGNLFSPSGGRSAEGLKKKFCSIVLVKYKVCKYKNFMRHVCNGTHNAEGSQSRRIYVQAQTWLIYTITCYTIYGIAHFSQVTMLAPRVFSFLACWHLLNLLPSHFSKLNQKTTCQLNFWSRWQHWRVKQTAEGRNKGGGAGIHNQG